jgi:hypothetical protein
VEESQDDRRSLRRALFLAALGAALHGAYRLWQLPGVLDDMSRVPRVTCDDLARNGPAGHRYVAVTDARLSGGRSVGERDGETGGLELYHPVYPAGLGREPDPRDLRLVLCVMDEGERRRVRDDRDRRAGGGRPGLGEFICAVRTGDGLPAWARGRLAAAYPNIRPDDCWVLVVGEKEPTPAFASHLAWHGGISVAAAAALFAWLWPRRQAGASGP